jgi:hypothetical protein
MTSPFTRPSLAGVLQEVAFITEKNYRGRGEARPVFDARSRDKPSASKSASMIGQSGTASPLHRAAIVSNTLCSLLKSATLRRISRT